MKPNLAEQLVSPASGGRLRLQRAVTREDGEIETGELRDDVSGRTYAIRGAIPRFVPAHGYAASFGFQWNRYARTQLDRCNGTTISASRFYRTSGWRPS